MDLPMLTHYVTILCTLFEQFEQHRIENKGPKLGCPYTYTEKMFIVFFIIMQYRSIYHFKTQWRWLTTHPEMVLMLGWKTVSHRKTISVRHKELATTIEPFITFVTQQAPDLEAVFATKHLVEDKSLFKAQGPMWHQSDRKTGRIPDKLRNLDTEATWSKTLDTFRAQL